MVLLLTTEKTTESLTAKKIKRNEKQIEDYKKHFKKVSLSIAQILIRKKLDVDKKTRYYSDAELLIKAEELTEKFFVESSPLLDEYLKTTDANFLDEQFKKVDSNLYVQTFSPSSKSWMFNDVPPSFFPALIDKKYCIDKQIHFIELPNEVSKYNSKIIFFIIKNEKFCIVFCFFSLITASVVLLSINKEISIPFDDIFSIDKESSIPFDDVLKKKPKKSYFMQNTIIIMCFGLVLSLIFFVIYRKYITKK